MAESNDTGTTDNGTTALQLLSGLARLLQSCSDEESLDDLFYWYLPTLFPDTRGQLFLFNEVGGPAEPRTFAWGREAAAPPSPDCPALERGLPYTVSGGGAPHCTTCEPGTVCLPIVSEEETVGLLRLSGEDGQPVHEYGLPFIVAEHIALAVANIRLRKRLLYMAQRDPLTGLFNRRYMRETMTQELSRADREDKPLSVMLFDLDHFKRVNDTFGHDAGDTVLQEVSRVVDGQLRTEDTACRYGGEEFLVVLSGLGHEDALARAEALRRAIDEHDIVHDGTEIAPVTCSIGVATYPLHATEAEKLISAADEALYHAKETGRNKVVGKTEAP